MAYDPKTGQWKPDPTPGAQTASTTATPDDFDPTSVEQRVNRITSVNSPLMQQAGAMGAKASNRRGLLNSSIGVQAGQAAVLDAAVPIATQDAANSQQTKVTGMSLASQERANSANLAAQFEGTYSQTVASIMENTNLPEKVRDKYLKHAAEVRDSNLRLVEQFYGVKLNWTSPVTPGSGPPPPPPPPPAENNRRGGIWDMRRRRL
jgi:hypothetical protein